MPFLSFSILALPAHFFKLLISNIGRACPVPAPPRSGLLSGPPLSVLPSTPPALRIPPRKRKVNPSRSECLGWAGAGPRGPSSASMPRLSVAGPTRQPFEMSCEFPRDSGDSNHRGASIEIARVRKHPSPPTQRGNRKGQGQCKGTNPRGPSPSTAGRRRKLLREADKERSSETFPL